MTYYEFLLKLRQTPRDWFLNSQQQIRYPRPFEGAFPCIAGLAPPACPLNRLNACLLLDGHDGKGWFSIASAADNGDSDDPAIQAIRLQLLEACGLTT